MDEYSIIFPMRPPLLESTTVVLADDNVKAECNTSLVLSMNDSLVEPNLLTDSHAKQQHDDTWGDDNDDDWDSFFKSAGSSPSKESSCSSLKLSGGAYPMRFSSNLHTEKLSGGIELCEAIGPNAVSMSCLKPTSPHRMRESLQTSSSLSPDVMSTGSCRSKESSHSVNHERLIENTSLKHKQNTDKLCLQHEQNAEKWMLDKRCPSGKCEETMDDGGCVCIPKSTAAVDVCHASNVAMSPRVSSVQSPVIRSRFNLDTNRFDEIVPAISAFDNLDLHDRTLPRQQDRASTCT